ncbi:hypothetical protein [Idiomarina sp. ST10R2A5]|uniref:hypothetical protein n=1 Tax=Idiomarina sp. ST10R2A5 TaxID=3418368 RepID=UPI003EC572D2
MFAATLDGLRSTSGISNFNFPWTISGVSKQAQDVCNNLEDWTNELICSSVTRVSENTDFNDQLVDELFTLFVHCRKSNWDGFDARPVSESTVAKSLELIIALNSEEAAACELTAEPDGDIAFDWSSESGEIFSISVNENGTLNYAGHFSDKNKVYGVTDLGEMDKSYLECLIKNAISKD